jgi:thiamine biosynthesis protein ThiS
LRIELVRDDLESETRKELETESQTVQELLEEIDVPSEEVIAARNGTIVSSEQELEEGDTVRVMDVIAGG